MKTETINFEELIDEISDLVQSVTPDGKFLYTNKAWRESLGYNLREISEMNLFDIIHPDSRDHCAKVFRQLLKGAKLRNIEAKFVTKDKKIIFVEGSSFCVLKNNQPMSTRSIFRDVTKRKKIEQNLRESQKMFHAFMNNSPAAAFMKNERGQYIFTNQFLDEMFRQSNIQEKTLTAYDLTDRKSAGVAHERFKQVLESGETLQTTDTVTMPDGSVKHMMVIRFPFAKGTTKFVGGFAFDITERIETEDRLRQSEERYRHIFENGQGFVCTHDRQGNFLSINPAIEKALGYNKTEIIGKNILDFSERKFHSEIKKQLKNVWKSLTDSGFISLRNAYGQKLIWKFQNVKITQATGEDFILVYAQDVTEMKRMENQLREMSFSDELTGLYNRRGFLEFAKRQIKVISTRPTGKHTYLLFADMDGLKKINDVYGHDNGSLAISKIGEILAGSFRASDVVARLGGDEFVVLITEATEKSPEIVISRLQSKIIDYNRRKQHPFELALSVGTTQITPNDNKSIDEILIEADQAMYEQKRRRKSNRT